MDNELTPVADHDSQRPPRPSFSSSIGNVSIESLSSTCAVPILFIPTLQIPVKVIGYSLHCPTEYQLVCASLLYRAVLG